MIAVSNSSSDTISLDELFSMSLEDLITLPVAVAIRTSQPIIDVPATTMMIASEDIRRSGAVSIPEALRMWPDIEASHCILQFVNVDGRLQFNLDLEAAQYAGIRFDPRMVSLANRVKEAK